MISRTWPYHPENTLFDGIHVLDKNRASISHGTHIQKGLEALQGNQAIA